MRPSARLLHALPIAAVAALAALPASAPAALAATTSIPAPYVVVLDPGHGGSPDNSRPDLQFDPGSTGVDGIVEKALTLDVARRVRRMLQDLGVRVVMTRDSDRFVSINQRTSIANSSGAGLFVSIHFNYFQDPSVGGSLVLYPSSRNSSFATAMSKAVSAKLQKLGIANNGTQLKDDLWTQTNMPTVTVEAGYITNPKEAHLLERPDTLDALASGITSGIQVQAPEIGQRRAALSAGGLVAEESPVRALRFPSAPKMPVWVSLAPVLAVGVLAVYFRRRVAPMLVPAAAITMVLIDRARGQDPRWRNRRGVRRRRSRAPLWSGPL